MALTQVNSEGIKDGEIKDADVNASAAIALSKLASTPAVLTGSTNNTITTVTGANAIQGEANLTFDGTTLVVTGDGQFTNDVLISDHIKHHGDTDTALRFPAADTFTVETGGSERVRVKSTGVDLGGNTNSSNGIGILRTKHHTTSNNPVNMIGCVSGSGYNNVQIGGNDTSFAGTASTAVRFYTAANATTANGTYRGQWDGSGNLSIDDGNLVVANGHGIDFSANTDGGSTSTSTLLEDYEEGTFSPTLGGQASGQSYTNQHGQYTKIGNMVTCTVHLKLAGDPGSSSNGVSVGDLPYTSVNTDGSMGGAFMNYNDDWVNTSGVTGNFTAMVNSGESVCKFYKTNGDFLAWSNLDSRTAQMRCTIIYRAA